MPVIKKWMPPANAIEVNKKFNNDKQSGPQEEQTRTHLGGIQFKKRTGTPSKSTPEKKSTSRVVLDTYKGIGKRLMDVYKK